MTHIYPSSLLPLLKTTWEEAEHFPTDEKLPPLPADEQLQDLLAIAYHASFLKEEGRKLTFRVITYPKRELIADGTSKFKPSRYAKLSEPRLLSVAELRRLAPAAESLRSMICVDLDKQKRWQIWALLDTGSNWWDFIHHESSSGHPPPSHLTISSASAGELTISRAGDILITLRSGSVYFPQSDLFFDGLISNYLEPTRKALYREVVKIFGGKQWDPEGHDNDYPKRFYNFCLSRILTCIRDKGHGGTVLLIPDELSATDPRLTDRVTIKYPSDYSYAWGLMAKHLELHRRYYDAHFPMWNSKKPLDPKDYQRISLLEQRREEIDESLSDCFRFIGSLSGVDGALVLTQRLSVIGFGAEVIALSPTLKQVKLALDAQARKKTDVSIEAYGTRHRSAFRFCSSYEDSVAFIVSQDGGIKAAKRSGRDVLMWPDVTMGSLGM